MKSFRCAAAIIVLTAAPHLWAAAPRPKTPPNIFESFHLLDQQFTTLDAQFHILQHALASGEPHPQPRGWQHTTKAMRRTTLQIQRFSYRMYRRYPGQSTLGHEMFVRLHSRARILQARLLRLSRARSARVARREEAAVAKLMLNLVLQYQAVSGGYAAATCSAGAWSCGVAKKEPREVGYPATGVKWTCVQQVAACHGILGPHAPLLTESPVTANGPPH